MTIDPVIAVLRELDKIDAYLALAREPHWSYRNAITTNKQNIRSAVAAARAALAAPMAAPEQDAYTVAAGLWRAALVGLCQGESTTFDTPDKAADNVRARLRHSNPASMHHRDAAAPNAAPEQGESLMRIGQDPSGMMWIYIDGGTDASGKLVHGAAIPVPPSDWATARLHVERLSAAAPMAAPEQARPSIPEGAARPQFVLYNGDTDEPYIDIDGSDLWCNSTDFAPKDRWKIRFMVKCAQHAAAPMAASAAPEQDERAWLVEWRAHGYGPQWWGFNYEPGKHASWCDDANKAVRLARREDAERMRLHIIAVAGLTGHHDYERAVTVTEHEWVATRPTPPQAAATIPAPPEGWAYVLVPKGDPGDEPDWNECARQAELATGLRCDAALSIVIREVRRWLAARGASPQAVSAPLAEPTEYSVAWLMRRGEKAAAAMAQVREAVPGCFHPDGTPIIAAAALVARASLPQAGAQQAREEETAWSNGRPMSDTERGAIREIAARLQAMFDSAIHDSAACKIGAVLLETWEEGCATPPPEEARPGAETPKELDEQIIEDYAHAAHASALEFGVSFDDFHRLAKSVAALVVKAAARASLPQAPTFSHEEIAAAFEAAQGSPHSTLDRVCRDYFEQGVAWAALAATPPPPEEARPGAETGAGK